jgi:hypoxanthine phosphoribosyltransferase
MTSKSGSSPEPDEHHSAAILPLFSAAAIGARVQALAGEIAQRPAAGEAPLVLIGLLRGAIPFANDLSRALGTRGLKLAIDYVSASSYGSGKVSSGNVMVKTRPSIALNGRDILIVDDILDTGLTMEAVIAAFSREAPARIATCVLLDKRARRLNGLHADFVGFPCPDLFVVGYGMDLDDRFRELPFIGTLASP